MMILDIYINRRYQVFGEIIKYAQQGRRIYRLMFNQINIDIDTVRTYEAHKDHESEYTALMQKQLLKVDPDNNKSEFMIIRSGRLEFTDEGRLFYGMMFGRALIDIRTIKTRVKFEKMIEVCEGIIMDCWVDFSVMHPGKSLFVDKMAAIVLDDDQKVDDIEEKMLMRDSVRLC
jgi:hypothetical protein